MFVAGDTVYVNELDTFGIVIEASGKTVNFYGKNGKSLVALHEVTRSDETLENNLFQFNCLYLPYGKWTCKDGTQVLFNRDYCAMWAKNTSGKVTPLAPDTWVVFEDEMRFADRKGGGSIEEKVDVLKEWGVYKEVPETLKRLFEAVKINDYDLVLDKNCKKKFYGTMAA